MLGEALFSIHADTATSEIKFTRNTPENYGLVLADGAFNAKPVLTA